ncbi:GNAT family N-acetyltransferase [Pelagovum pacificum]|uniref:GNAT family N-acetyltransferase n=1 Tax=Pelagovum pacificum TaxID=2588711 RepID=A0A5C5GDN8_9RHOB|nr:GNAT family N-acetyltransferase [Pelagovum pacificum]QQA43981.1 GNAT family N-acetyltransferase [Pelagovum pacificum]TNY32892.1 GNAT family N-acetyltransferase [Pelagovum pacificum]
MSLSYRILRGADVEDRLDDLAALRIDVFRDWPYIYDGSMDYERRYMASYRDNPDAVLVGAFDGDSLVGAATGSPMEAHGEDFAAPFEGTDIPLAEIFYCAESVLRAEYRGQGAGHAFFDAREAHARALGRRYSAFCSVMRPDDHPLRPADHRALDPFWRKRGYEPLEGVIARFRWRDVGETEETEKPLQFWMKRL